jgi:hypothetical protein
MICDLIIEYLTYLLLGPLKYKQGKLRGNES